MANIVKQEENYIDSLREEHINSPGDIFFSRNRAEIIRLKSLRNENYWNVESYVFESNSWKDFYNLSNSDLKAYYTLNLQNFDELVESAKQVMEGRYEASESPDVDESSLVVQDRAYIDSLLKQTELAYDKAASIEKICKAMIQERMNQMEAMKRSLDVVISDLHKKVQNVRKVISVLSVYSGLSVDFSPIIEGEFASIDSPLYIRQRILYMDEEFLVNLEYGGADYKDKDNFFEALKDKKFRDIIVPEEKCIVCMKPRRWEKLHHTNSAYENRLLNEYNFHTFILVRNGENLWVAESDDFCIYDSAIPRKTDFESLEKEYKEGWKDSAQNKYENLNYRAVLYGMFVQGLIDNTQMFPHEGVMSVSKGIGVEFIYDDDNLIGSGIKEWPDFVKEINSKIERGTRIVYIGDWGLRGGHFSDYRYNNEKFHPVTPASGIYSIDYEKDTGYKSFLYLPDDTVFYHKDYEYYSDKRKKRVRFIPYSDHMINYDEIDIETLDRYLQDRTQRKYYCKMIPLLRKVKELKEEEKRDEDAFVELMIADINKSRYGRNDVSSERKEKAIREAIEWWKYKVIYKRPLRSDDAKAWRMIKEKAVDIYLYD